jgi:hypothetical protein
MGGKGVNGRGVMGWKRLGKVNGPEWMTKCYCGGVWLGVFLG